MLRSIDRPSRFRTFTWTLGCLGGCLGSSLFAWPPFDARATAAEVEGFTEPYRKVDVAPSEPGLLAQLLVREGEAVAKEQALGRLDCDVLEVSLAAAQATVEATGRLDSARAERELRRNRLEKLSSLRTKGFAMQDEVERARADLEIAEANARAVQDQQTLNALELKKVAALIERRTIRSPIDGVVIKIFHEEHEFVVGATPTVMTVVQLDRLKAQFAVPAHEVVGLAAGQKAPLTFMEGSSPVTATIDFISPVTDPESGTVRVQVLLENKKGKYRSGARCWLHTPSGATTPRSPEAGKSTAASPPDKATPAADSFSLSPSA